jgi:hypothetical protein
MARENTREEAETRREMTEAYQQQKTVPNGFDDWGKFTAHIVCAHRQEIQRLRQLLADRGVSLGPWDDFAV